MTLAGLVAKNALRNKRRSMPTILSIGFSILLLTVMLTLWHSFYIDELGPASALCIFTRTHLFFSYSMPNDYRQKIKLVPGVVALAPLNIFNGVYKDGKSKDRFPQGGTDKIWLTEFPVLYPFHVLRSGFARGAVSAPNQKAPLFLNVSL
jgi:hypothetical protein